MNKRSQGFTLIEVLVALALFAVLSASVLTLLGASNTLTRDDNFRLEAVNLATRELEITRDAFGSASRGPTTIATNRVINPSPLPGGTAGAPLVIDNVPYTVTRDAQWSAVNAAAASTCDEGTSTELAYLRVHVEVTWPGLEDRPPVVMDTVLTPPKGTYSSTDGHLGIKVNNRDGEALAGRAVKVVGPAGTLTAYTAADGCALFAFIDPGTYQVTLDEPGYVTRTSQQSAALTARVEAAQMWRGAVDYDRYATLLTSFDTVTGYSLPTVNDIPVTLANSALLPAGSRLVTGTGNTRTLSPLWPFASGYQLWAGACLDNDPAYTGQQRDLPVITNPGGVSSVKIPLAALRVRAAAGATVQATQPADSSCASGQRVTLGRADGNGDLLTSLPYGEWTITASTGSAEVTLTRGAPPAEADVR